MHHVLPDSIPVPIADLNFRTKAVTVRDRRTRKLVRLATAPTMLVAGVVCVEATVIEQVGQLWLVDLPNGPRSLVAGLDDPGDDDAGE